MDFVSREKIKLAFPLGTMMDVLDSGAKNWLCRAQLGRSAVINDVVIGY